MRRFAFATVLFVALSAGAATAQDTITVTGTGEASAPPDMATLSFGVTTESDAAGAAMAANSEAMARVMARLADAGVAERDMQTTTLSVSPRWRQPGPDRDAEVAGFVASNALTVRVRDLPALGGILDAALADGANTLGGLSFGVSDDAALRDKARRSAVEDATRAARVLAEAAGLTLGAVREIEELGASGGPRPFARMDMAMSESVPIAAGEATIRADVRIMFSTSE